MKSLTWTLAAATLALTIAAPVRSIATDENVTQRFEEIYANCGKEGEVASVIATCVMEKEGEYDKELERLYKRLLKNAAPNAAILREQQRNWLKYQKQHCDSYYDLKENEGWGPPRLSSARCLLRTTLQRIEELRELSATPLHSEESVDGTAWQCGRDYIVPDHIYGTIYRNQTGAYHDAEDVNLAATPPPGAPANYRVQKEYRWKQDKLYYRGKPCAKVKPPPQPR